MKILIATGSVRKGRISDAIQQLVTKELESREGVEVTVADFKDIQLPFFDNERTPNEPEYEINNEPGREWSRLVSEADGVVLLTPEYNRSISAVQKNAIDTLYREWEGKPVVAVAYGWHAGQYAMDTLRVVLSRVNADLKPVVGGLTFKKDIELDGSVVDETAVQTILHDALDQFTN